MNLKILDYHEQLRQRMETVQEDDFPCLDCPQRFSEYHKYKLHARKQLKYTVLYKNVRPGNTWQGSTQRGRPNKNC